ncbi:hypothetical protein C8R43DRAFT_1143054 [Mycena crocata]|nr:hypothetical protein C8R43DRAFT_1143054 [Mycena crocata]
MTNIPRVSSGTGSVPVAAASFPPGSDASAVAAYHFFNAMASLNHGSQPVAAVNPQAPSMQATVVTTDAAPAPAAPAIVAPAAPAPVLPAPSVTPTPTGFFTSGPWIAGNLYLVVPTGPLLPIGPLEDTDVEGPVWYCITKGRYVGITLSNALALSAVVGVRHCCMKSYKTQALALAAFNELRPYGMVNILA